MNNGDFYKEEGGAPWFTSLPLTPALTNSYPIEDILNKFLQYDRAKFGGQPINVLLNETRLFKRKSDCNALVRLLVTTFEGRIWQQTYNLDCTRFEYCSVISKWGTMHLVVDDDEITISVRCPVLEMFESIISVVEKYTITPTKAVGSTYSLLPGPDGIQLKYIGLGGEPLIRDNYNPATIEAYDNIAAQLSSDDPSGKIFIFGGAPGCGKTYLIRALINDISNTLFVIVSSEYMRCLTDPSVLPAFLDASNRYKKDSLTLILEDADQCLSVRGGDNMGIISSMLNLGDGVIGSILNVRIIATTNAKTSEFDPAIMRPGRLGKYCDVGQLNHEQASKVFARLRPNVDLATVAGHTNTLTLAEVYHLSRFDTLASPLPVEDQEANKPQQRRIGF